MSEGDIGRVLNQRYRLSRSLGRGGMGEVWLAVDTALGREVAVKELLFPPSLDEGARQTWSERSRREASAAARIRHENVVTVHDVFEEDGRPWIVMELVVSRSLAEVVRAEGRLDFAEAARIGLGVLRALRAAHAKGVLHRDVKPANVLLGFDGRVVLTDFGIATFADAPQVTHVGELLGTPGYLAPERAERFATGGGGEPDDGGRRSDASGADAPDAGAQDIGAQDVGAPGTDAPDAGGPPERTADTGGARANTPHTADPPAHSATAGPAVRRPVRGSEETLGMSGDTVLDPASDLWSLGATLYEMVEGRPPFSRSSPVEVVDAVVNQDPLPLRHAGPLAPVIMGLLRKDPADRLDAKETEELLVGVVQDALAPTWGGELPPPRRPPDAVSGSVTGLVGGPGVGAYRAGLGSGHTATHRSTPRPDGGPDGPAPLRKGGGSTRGAAGRASGSGRGGAGTYAAEGPGALGTDPHAPHDPLDPVDPTWGGDVPDDAPGGTPRPRWRRLRVLVPAVVVLALIAASVPLVKALRGSDASSDPFAELREESPAYQAMTKRGYMIIGVKPDQPGLSQKGPDGEYTGFDSEIARMIAADLGFEGRVRFVDVETQGREYRISSGQVDVVVASYTINAERLEKVSFAGPYFIAGQDFLVRRDDQGAARPEDLGGSRVCVVRESTSAARIREKFPTMQIEERGKYSECVDELRKKNVRGVSTDDTILAGFVAQFPDELRVLGSPFSEEPYGVGLSRGDAALAEAVCTALNRHVDNGDWQRAYDATLGRLSLLPPRPPKCAPNLGG